MKKTIINLCLWVALAGGLSSCYKDHTVIAPRAISSISLADGATPIADRYTGRFGDVFTLTAPDVKQSQETQPLSCRWEIYPPTLRETDGARTLPRVVTTRELSLPLEAYGTYDVNLFISNADNSYIKRFKVEIPTPYGIGLYVLLNKAGTPEIGYVPASGYDSANDATTYQEGLQRNNPVQGSFAGFPAAPSSLATLQSLRDRFVSLTLVDGTTYVLNANTMQVAARDPYTAEAGEAKIISQNDMDMRGLIRNGQFYSYNTSSYFYIRQLRGQYLINQRYPNTVFSDQAALVSTAIGNAAVLYDNTRRVVFLMQTANFRRMAMNSTLLNTEDNLTKWQGSKLVAMTAYGNRDQVALLLQSTSTPTAYYLVRFTFAGGTSAELMRLTGFTDVPTSVSLSDASRLAASRDVIYLSAANEIYTYVAGSTNFSSSPVITLPQGEKVVQMVTRTEGTSSFLYVATTDGTNSSLYYYDVTSGTSGTLVWSKTGISGQILQIDYRLS